TDLVSNASGPLEATFPFVAVPPPAAWHGFDTDAGEVASWGDVAWLGGKAGYDARCEEGGCVELGPFVPQSCGGTRTGVAGRLQPLPAATTVFARVRVLAADLLPDSNSSASFEASIALTFEVAVPGGAPARLPVAATGFQDLGPGAGPLHWATPWMWVSLP